MTLILSPVVLLISLLKLKVIKEMCPLSVNIILFIIILLLFLIFALIITTLEKPIFNKIKVKNADSDDLYVVSLVLTFIILIYLAEFVWPQSMISVLSWLNLRLAFAYLFLFIPMVVILNSVTKITYSVELSKI